VARSREPEFDGVDEDGVDQDGVDESLDDRPSRDRDGVAALRDVEAEAGDEAELTDDYDMDDRAARELGADLDDRDEPEPGLD
jgi:hypothetical protein